MLSYGGIGFILVGLTSAAYLHFKQKQNSILRWISWGFIGSTLFVLVLKNILFECYLIRSTSSQFMLLSWGLDDWIFWGIQLVNNMMNESLIFFALGISLSLILTKLFSFSEITKVLLIIACVVEGLLGLTGHLVELRHMMINLLGGIMGYVSFIILFKVLSLKESLLEI